MAALDKHDSKAARQAIEQILVATREMVIAAVPEEEESSRLKNPKERHASASATGVHRSF